MPKQSNDKNSEPKKVLNPDDRRPKLDDEKKREMLAVVVRNQKAFEAVHDLLTVREVRMWANSLGTLWSIVRQFYKKYSELPDKNLLLTEIGNRLTSNPTLLDQEERDEIDVFVEYAWDEEEHGKNIEKSAKHTKVAITSAKQMLEENIAARLQDGLNEANTMPADVPKMLEAARGEVDRVQSMTDVKIDVPFPDGWDHRVDMHLVQTGIEPLDAFFGGGLVAGEVALFMGPYGSCKTTVACNGTANQLHMAAQLLASGDSRKDKKGNPMIPVVVLIFTESDKNEYRNRLMSNLALVPWKRLSHMKGIAALDGSDKPGNIPKTKYELKVFKKSIANDHDWKNEQQRVQEAQLLANKHLLILDCTDADENTQKIGSGGMEEIANVLKSIFRTRKDAYPMFIWMDHLSGLIDRMGDLVKDEHALRWELTNSPRIAGDKICKPLKCPIVLMHQFAGAAQNKGVVAKFHHADSEGSKSVGKYPVFCVAAGEVDGNKMCRWECTKHRREPGSAHRIVQVQGQFNRLIDRTDTHGIDVNGRCIMSNKEMGSVGSVKAGKKKGKATFNSGITDVA